ncbi:MAG: RNA polymerase sigma factor [Bryobacterales bacterium]|nr:RNA polymerase sigma factor [Bryobacterales bacterium]MBV9399276.1 RNA polymerase sigma factor [Bryobacterales bacterium]
MRSDAEVVDRVRAGEIGLYELLMQRHNQRLYRVIRSVVTNDLEAEDILQESWVRAYEHLDQFEGRASFATWITRIAFHEALSRRRISGRWRPLEDEAGNVMPESDLSQSTGRTPEAQAIQSEMSRILQAAVDALPETYRSVFMLREVEQLNTTETAECLGLSEEAVKTRLHRSRVLLRRDLESRVGSTIREAYPFLGARCDRVVGHVLDRIGAKSMPMRN